MTLVVRIQRFPIHLPSVSGISAGVGSVLQQGDFKHQNGGLVETIPALRKTRSIIKVGKSHSGWYWMVLEMVYHTHNICTGLYM